MLQWLAHPVRMLFAFLIMILLGFWTSVVEFLILISWPLVYFFRHGNLDLFTGLMLILSVAKLLSDAVSYLTTETGTKKVDARLQFVNFAAVFVFELISILAVCVILDLPNLVFYVGLFLVACKLGYKIRRIR